MASLRITPSREDVDSLKALATEVLTRDEGILVPLSGQTGIGKTTFAMNASQWVPTLFGPTLSYDGDIAFDTLVSAAKTFVKPLPADSRRIVSINVDHRENAPPSDEELATLTRFLRTNAAGVPSLVFWPETNSGTAEALASRYIDSAG